MSERIPHIEHVDSLSFFKKVINERRERDLERGTPVHLFNVHVDELTEEDLAVRQKIKNETITIEEYRAYRSRINGNTSKSRIGFAQFAANITSSIIANRQLDERAQRIKNQEI